MPYKANKDLPDPVRSALPEAAQSIWRKAYNAHVESDPNASEASCARIAWAAVKAAGWKQSEAGWSRDASETFSIEEHIALDADAKMRRTADGYLVAYPRVARTGIQEYSGDELGRSTKKVLRVYRPEDVVFDAESMRSYAHRPITNDHPKEVVTSVNWKRYAVGQIGDEVMRDGDCIRVPVMLMDAAAIKDIDNGKRELSLGYGMEIDWTPGIAPHGEAYDGVMTRITANHLAVVAAARGGSRLKIGDVKHGARNMSDRVIMIQVGDQQVEVANDVAASTIMRFITNLSKEAGDLRAKIERDAGFMKKKEEEEEEYKKDRKAKDEALATKDAEIITLKKQLEDAQKAATPEALDALVKDRQTVIDKARATKLLGDKLVVADRSSLDIKRQIVTAYVGDRAPVKDWSEAQINASFDTIPAAAGSSGRGNDSLARDIGNSRTAPNQGTVNDERSALYDARDKAMENAWRNPPPAATQ